MQQHGRTYFANRPPPPTLRMESIGQNLSFQNMAMLHIKLKGITSAATW